ncbi:MAG: methenyltetrahydromethanopterin cyclohydrolase [Candidatus Hydrothermarchaeaceae archaeon]
MNLNDNARKIVVEMIERRDELNIAFVELKNGAKVVDCGIKCRGGLVAGGLFAKVCMGGLAEVKFSEKSLNGISLPFVNVRTDFPYIACVCSQKAGWKISEKGFFAIGSGPARILAEKSCHRESSDSAVIALETSAYPDENISRKISKACGIEQESLYVLVTRTASTAGSVQVSARMVETALFKLEQLGYDVKKIESASGDAPVAPVTGSDNQMMGLSNDMVIYGSRVALSAGVDIDVKKVPSSSSREYGRPFSEVFKAAGYDFYSIDQSIFAPAEFEFRNTSTGEVKRAGKINMDVIKRLVGV